jgi:hypothetical protein
VIRTLPSIILIYKGMFKCVSKEGLSTLVLNKFRKISIIQTSLFIL